MEDYFKYFKEQIKESSDYFETWYYRKENQVFISQGKPIKDSLYRDLYDVFSDYSKEKVGNKNEISHNCIGCNFEEGARNILLFFKYNNEVLSQRYFLTLYTLLFYLQAERLAVIYKELGYINSKKEFDWEKFPNLQRIKCWANFFKHPKSYMLLHHPDFFIEGDPYIPNFMVKGIIDEEFVRKFYNGWKYNEDLREVLSNQEDFKIIFPNLLNFTKCLCFEFEKIISVILSDKANIEKLSTFSTIKSKLSR